MYQERWISIWLLTNFMQNIRTNPLNSFESEHHVEFLKSQLGTHFYIVILVVRWRLRNFIRSIDKWLCPLFCINSQNFSKASSAITLYIKFSSELTFEKILLEAQTNRIVHFFAYPHEISAQKPARQSFNMVHIVVSRLLRNFIRSADKRNRPLPLHTPMKFLKRQLGSHLIRPI